MHSADDKARAIKDHFQEHLGQPPRRECTLNWEEIPVSRYNLSDLDAYLIEEEIKTVVMHAPTEKVPGRMVLLMLFTGHTGNTIKHDIVTALREMFALRGGC
jgi:hypothetical protein